MGVRNETRRVIKESWREVKDENVTFMAGSIAYHAFVSMLPLLVFLLFVLSAVGNEEFTALLAELSGSFLTPYARELLVDSFNATAARTGVSLVGAITLLWGTSKIFRGLDVAFSRIYNSRGNRSLLDQFENAVVVFVSLAVAITAFVAAGLVVALFPDLPYPPWLNPVLLVAGLVVAFFPIYYVFPDVDLTPWEVVPGVLLAAVGWAVLEAVFQGYVRFAGRYEAVYGTLGSAFLLLIWLYFSGLVLLLGGVVNAVLAGRTGDEHALRVTAEVSADAEQWDDGRASGDRRRSDAPGDRPLGDERDSLADDPARSALPDGVQRRARRGDRADLVRSYEQLGRAYERLDSDHQRLRRRVERLEAENARLERENEALTRQVTRRRRSIWERARRWLFGERK